jgi:CheY-like chemotaxis protein
LIIEPIPASGAAPLAKQRRLMRERPSMSRDDSDPCGCGDPAAGALRRSPAAATPRVCVVDTDNDWRALLEEWLHQLGCMVVPDDDAPGRAAPPVDLVIVDVPFPRQGGVDLVKRIVSRHPATPIVALSSNFFSRVECCGPVAQALGVNCVLAKPATREAIAAAVLRALPR